MIWQQRELVLRPRPRGVHLITDEVLAQLPELQTLAVGLLHLFLKHTSASLTVNENVSPDVLHDLEEHLNRSVPQDPRLYTHDDEGADDMPAHIKAVLIGSDLTLPVRDGRVQLGTWQGLYLCEHRDRAAARHLVATWQGRAAR